MPRGGARSGAGRKPAPGNKIRKTFRLSPEVCEILDQQSNKTAFIEDLVMGSKNLVLKCGIEAVFKYEDDWSRPVYEFVLNDKKIKACCVNLNGTYLHSMTTYGEPLSPLAEEYQPIEK